MPHSSRVVTGNGANQGESTRIANVLVSPGQAAEPLILPLRPSVSSNTQWPPTVSSSATSWPARTAQAPLRTTRIGVTPPSRQGKTPEMYRRCIGGVSEVYRKCIGGVSDQHAVNAGSTPDHPQSIALCSRLVHASASLHSLLSTARFVPSVPSVRPSLPQPRPTSFSHSCPNGPPFADSTNPPIQ